MGESKKKKWSVNSTILPQERSNFYFVDPADHEKNLNLLMNIKEGKYVLMYGPRASGKSTWTWRAMEQLQASGYFCIYITLTGVNFQADQSEFWQSLGVQFRGALCDFFGPTGSLKIDTTVPDIKTSSDFLSICLRQNELWKLLALKRKEPGQPKHIDNKFLVIFIDEFDTMVHSANTFVRDSFQSVLYSIMTTGDRYAVQSVVGVGTFNILTINTEDHAIYPFNISDAIKNPNFTPEQVITLFKEFAMEYKFEIPDEVIQDIYVNSNGYVVIYLHAGLINLCGLAIQTLVTENAYVLNGRLSYEMWKIYRGQPLEEKIAEYHTFDKMIKLLSKESSRDANNLLRTYFLGYRGEVILYDTPNHILAIFLVGEGILLPAEGAGNEMAFKMSSPYMDSLIRRRILPSLDKFAPKKAPIKRTNETYDVLQLVLDAVKYFNKDILCNAFIHAYKTPRYGKVEGRTFQNVPRESVYDSELYRVLICWLVDLYGMRVTGQWHATTVADPNNLDSKLEHEFFDIVISTRITQQPHIILELMASGVKNEVQEHYDKALKYGSHVENPEVWVIHFTCLDDVTVQPHLQSESELNQGLNVAHFWHNRVFTKLRLWARWHEDKEIKTCKDFSIDI
ncbi:hypothetical protein BC937DRAFT_89064 [Endogone sp. FLAS-F59071]|nr:hypothetical protein BC937DRAFT_89064 [Endogone sp. FLAS-F59071]|eukprot:RUS18183.1 hypothetical protein BC937DRAFT_89064 [Endogone sp. FLAS-F59071]